MLNNRILNLENNSVLNLNTNGTGDVVTNIIKSGATITVTLGSPFSLSTHTHNQLYQPDGLNPFVYTDNSG